MDELIYKEQALNCFHDWFDKYGDVHTPDEIAAYRAIEALPSVDAEPQWIPVAERLPDKDGRYLVTCSKIGAWEVDWNIWHCEPKPSWLWEQSVTAWMPLPESYSGE